MPQKTKYDWDKIYQEYRAGTFTISELSRRHGCSRKAIQKRIKSEGWKQDLHDAVKKATKAKMVKADAESGAKVAGKVAPCDTEATIDAASDFYQNIYNHQRADIAKLRELELKLINMLFYDPTKLYLTQYKGKIVKKTVKLTASELAQAANNLANVQHKRIQLERQAYSLGADDGEVETIEFDLTEKKAIRDAAKLLATKIKRGSDG